MTTEFLLLYILLIHFLADFALQTHHQAVNKSTDVMQLTYHCLVYTFIWALAVLGLPFVMGPSYFGFICYTFITHYITDYCTSRIGKPYWENQDFHNGFVIVGIDQIIHYITLYISLKYILNIL